MAGNDEDFLPAKIHESYYVNIDGEGYTFLKNEKNCWRCKGWGHTAVSCPSDARIKRPINACIQGLQSIKDAESSRANAGGKGRGPRVFRRPGSSPGRPAARPKAHALTSIPDLIEYDDGGIYTSSGEEVRAPIDPAPPDETPPIEAVPVANPA